jgi:hypothetical protein
LAGSQPAAGTSWQEGNVRDDTTGNLKVDVAAGNVTLATADIEIGAVELKDSTTNDRVAVSAAGRLSVDASGVPVPITSASSLTVGAPVGTPLAARLSDGAVFFDPRIIRALTAADVVTVNNPTAANLKVDGSGVTQPVSGTFWQATQAVSLAANTPDVTDRAARDVGRVRLWDGVDEGTITPVGATKALDVNVVQSVAVGASTALYKGRTATFRIPGRAGTVGQKIFALHNATGSTAVVHLEKITVDLVMTVVKAVTVLPPVIRLHRFTAVPTFGTAVTKVPENTSLASNASVTAWGDASADGTSSATALTVTIPAGQMLTEEFAPRLITAAGYEMFDRTTFLEADDEYIVLRALEGVVVELAYVLATQNPITDMWTVAARWSEF